jgi:hypothetical protein
MDNTIEEQYAYEILESMKFIHQNTLKRPQITQFRGMLQNPSLSIKKDHKRLICRVPPSPIHLQHSIDSSNDLFILVNCEQYAIICLNHGGEGSLKKNFIVEKKGGINEYKIQLKRHFDGKIIEDFCDEDFSQVQSAKKKRKL